jgi:hypothetical protein
MVVVCNVIRVMKNSTNTMEKLLAKVAFMWAGRIIDVRLLAINASCAMTMVEYSYYLVTTWCCGMMVGLHKISQQSKLSRCVKLKKKTRV